MFEIKNCFRRISGDLHEIIRWVTPDGKSMISVLCTLVCGCIITKEISGDGTEFVVTFNFKDQTAEHFVSRTPDVANPFERQLLSYFHGKKRVPLVYTIPLPCRVKPTVLGRDKFLGKKELPAHFVWHLEEWPEGERVADSDDSDDST